jgi:molybdenum cofactor cytidylyltransferase
MGKVSAILLGAGESKRMGASKLALPWGKETVLEHALHILLQSKVMEVIVVLSDRTKDLESLLRGPRIKLVMNPHYKKGMSTSIRRGLRVVDSRSDGILIALGDQPYLKPATVNLLLRAFERGKGTIVVPVFQGRRGHPVVFNRAHMTELSRLEKDMGARSLLQKYPQRVVEVKTRSKGVVKDIDTWEDYQRGNRART